MGSTASKTGRDRSGSISAPARWKILQELSTEYFEFLAGKGGMVLTAEQRVHIADLTLRETLGCTACAGLPKDVCLQPGTDIYLAIAKLHDHDNESQNDNQVLVHMIHSIVNHQAKISQDPEWYQTTMEKLQTTTSLIDQKRLKEEGIDTAAGENQKLYLVYALFAEIVSVVSAVHSLNMVAIMKGDPTPNVIPAKKNASPPTYLDWSQIFLPGKTATRDCNRATMPFIGRSDIDRNHPSLLKLIPKAEQLQSLLDLGMEPMAPFLCLTWSPVDYLWMERLDDVLYVDVDDFFSPYKSLDPAKRCADKFSRHDIEIIAVAVSDGYECTF